jgi:hypothetical protein
VLHRPVPLPRPAGLLLLSTVHSSIFTSHTLSLTMNTAIWRTLEHVSRRDSEMLVDVERAENS